MSGAEKYFPTDLLADMVNTLTPHETFYPDFSIPVFQAFIGWNKIVPYLSPGNYIVVFESTRSLQADTELLEELDSHALSEAQKSPGYMAYYQGTLHKATRACRSFCIWESADKARLATRQPMHSRAAREGVLMYDYYGLKRYVVRYADSAVLPFFVAEQITSNK